MVIDTNVKILSGLRWSGGATETKPYADHPHFLPVPVRMSASAFANIQAAVGFPFYTEQGKGTVFA